MVFYAYFILGYSFFEVNENKEEENIEEQITILFQFK